MADSVSKNQIDAHSPRDDIFHPWASEVHFFSEETLFPRHHNIADKTLSEWQPPLHSSQSRRATWMLMVPDELAISVNSLMQNNSTRVSAPK